MNEPKLVSVSRIRQIISLIDLTNLNDNCDDAAIETLCSAARTPAGYVAAVCVWPAFASKAKQLLGQHSPVKIATVVNFPGGNESLKSTCTSINKALDDGADEIDYVLPYTEFLRGNIMFVASALQTVRRETPDNVILKVILESGVLDSRESIRTAAKIAIDQGADFIKTSTGKVPVNATVDAANIMLKTIALSQAQTQRSVGFKAAGGIKTIDDAILYLNLAEQIFGQEWADSAHFRFGASGLLQDALSKLDIASTADAADNY